MVIGVSCVETVKVSLSQGRQLVELIQIHYDHIFSLYKCMFNEIDQYSWIETVEL